MAAVLDVVRDTGVGGAVGMTLAAIAYAPDRATIQRLLADTTLATSGTWSLAWYGVDAGNQMFVARDAVSGCDTIAIRGSVTDPHTRAFWIDWFGQDLSVFRLGDWPYGGAPAGSKIAHGALNGLGSLLSLKDADGNTLCAFLRSHPSRRTPTSVVGHSLGGALATVLAPYLQQEFAPTQETAMFQPVTFAGPTAGNAPFAGWLADRFGMAGNRYHNTLDIVPHVWQQLDWIAGSYAGGPSLPFELKPLLDGIRDVLKLVRDDYTQPTAGVALAGAVAGGIDWFAEAGEQHATATYLKLLGAPPIPS
jgi:hypothetical protein